MLGIIIGATLYFNQHVVVEREIINTTDSTYTPQRGENKLDKVIR